MQWRQAGLNLFLDAAKPTALPDGGLCREKAGCLTPHWKVAGLQWRGETLRESFLPQAIRASNNELLKDVIPYLMAPLPF
ncbi:unnamed protein product [Merluccius merluccius]